MKVKIAYTIYRRSFRLAVAWACISCLLWCPADLSAGDWPQLGYDAGHCSVSPDDLPRNLHLQWARQLHKPRPAWPPSQFRMQFDVSYSPVAAGKLLFVPSMVTDSVTAYDTETGRMRWRFYTDGPVRFAPIADSGKVYFTSDDGHLYCVKAADGKLLWRFAGAAADRKVIGHERVISTWPIRGGPVLLEGRIYLTAGIWPFMGIFAHAVDTKTQQAIWTNSGAGAQFRDQPHSGAAAFAGFVPRGQLAATKSGIIAPGGRTHPGCYDPENGRLRYFEFGQRYTGGSRIAARGKRFFFCWGMYNIANGKKIGGNQGAVHTEKASYGIGHKDKMLFAQPVVSRPQPKKPRPKKQAAAKPAPQEKKLVPEGPWRLRLGDGLGQLFLRAGRRFYAGGEDIVAAIEVNLEKKAANVVWKAAIKGKPWVMLAADDKLFVVTRGGGIYCFGAKKAVPVTYGDLDARQPEKKQTPGLAASWREKAQAILKATGAREGYCVVLGLGTGQLAEALVGASKLRLVVVEPDQKKVSAFRNRMGAAGLYGTRISAHVGEPTKFHLPQYMGSLVVSEDVSAAGVDRGVLFANKVFHALRPYGGAAYFEIPKEKMESLVGEAKLAGASVRAGEGSASILTRKGAPPGSADWTHQYGDAGNSVCSQDKLVKLPLGLLWFGGPSNDQVLPRHGHGPSPQVAAGRLFIEGRHMLRAIDIYTGRLLWQRKLQDLGRFYDNTSHHPGANLIGTNYVSLPDAVYVVYGRKILRLDAGTGQTLSEFALPAAKDGKSPYWGYIAAWKELLVATAFPTGARYAAASKRLVVMDRRTGKVLWARQAEFSFRHNNIAIGADKIFCIDGWPLSPKAQARRGRGAPKGQDAKDKPKPEQRRKLMALDVRTGKQIWRDEKDIFGTFLNYSAEHDVLLEGGSSARDRARDEARAGMVTRRGASGKIVWQNRGLRYSGPCILRGDTIITQLGRGGGPAYSLLTGKAKMRKHPLTGKSIPWRYYRYYGCNTATAGRNMLLFRSGAAGFYDLLREGGTGNFGGFKSGCTSNMIPAGGVLAAPEYTRTCICHYQNQTSLGLIHDPGAEMWTFNVLPWDGSPIRRMGINFGALGDRRTDDGTLWLEHPRWGGPGPNIPVTITPAKVDYFRLHSSFVKAETTGGSYDWVGSSCGTGFTSVTLVLSKAKDAEPRSYTVRLHFAEIAGREAGKRVFNVSLQGKRVLAALDVAKEAGGRSRAIAREFKGVKVADKLEVTFEPVGKESAPALLSGIQIIAEGW